MEKIPERKKVLSWHLVGFLVFLLGAWFLFRFDEVMGRVFGTMNVIIAGRELYLHFLIMRKRRRGSDENDQ